MIMKKRLLTIRQFIQRLTGEDAYQRYLDHWYREHDPSEGPPLSRRDFFIAEEQRKWNRPNRCC